MKNILIVSVNAIGDTYISLSALEVLKRNIGQVKINYVIDKPSAFLLYPLKDIKTYILKSKNLINLIILLLEIRKQKYDYILNFFPGRFNTVLTFLTKGRIKAGYFNILKVQDWYNKSQKVKVMGINSVGKFWIPKMSYLKRVELVLDSVGIREEINSKFKFLNISLKKSNYIIIHPFSRYLNRALSFETIALLIDELKNKYDKRIIIIGNQSEFGDKYLKLQEKDIAELIFKDKIEDLIYLIMNAFLFIGVDSFPIHIADAHNINIIGIFGPTNPKSVLVNFSNAIRFDTNNLNKLPFKDLITGIESFCRLKL